MNRNIRYASILLLAFWSTAARGQSRTPAATSSICYPFDSREAAETFLRTARITKITSSKVGVTLPRKVELSDGSITHPALFKTIDDRKPGLTQMPNGAELDFKDSWKFEIAAYELDKILGLGMVPVTVERSYQGQRGSLQLWLDGCQIEGERLKKNLQPPDLDAWNHQMYKVRVFDNLVYNIDRNLGNLLISTDWKLFMIDHSRTFKNYDRLKSPKDITSFSISLMESLKTLTPDMLRVKCGKYVSGREIGMLLKRRDLLVKLFEEQKAARGNAVLYP
jgi:hypothetical protein